MDIESGGESQIQVHFKTKQVQYAISDVPYSIDGNVTTVELNTFINTLLSSSSSSSLTNDPYVEVEFDFLVFDELLRVRLAEHLREKGISFEDNIEIEYVERFPAPEPQDCLLHDDWVSAVETCDKWILTGCYDNTINLWTIKGKHVLTIPGHTMPIKAVTWISINDDGKAKFISCSQDQTCILWDWTIDSNSVECISVGKGHERGIDCVSVNPNKQRFATGSWDTMLKIWSTDINEITTQVSKRSKPDSGSVKTPQMTLQGHRECISAVQWIDNETLVTGSWDHTLKIWDLNLEGIKAEISTNKSIFDASYSNLNRLIITASADKHLRLYDSRTKYGSVVRNTYFGHQQWVQTVMWSNTEEYLFVSGSYDNTNKLWDCRSPKAPLYDLIGHSDKVMDIDWSNPKYIVSGGADNTIRIYKSRKAFQKQNNTKQKNLVT